MSSELASQVGLILARIRRYRARAIAAERRGRRRAVKALRKRIDLEVMRLGKTARKTDKLVLIAILFCSLALRAQAPPALPQAWAGAGAAYNAYAGPPVNGWASYALLISAKAQVYSFTTHDLTSSTAKPYTVQTSVRSGLATVLRTLGPIVILGFGDAGLAAAGTSAGSAFSGGGVGLIRLGKTQWTIALGGRQLKTAIGGSQTIWEMGFGRMF